MEMVLEWMPSSNLQVGGGKILKDLLEKSKSTEPPILRPDPKPATMKLFGNLDQSMFCTFGELSFPRADMSTSRLPSAGVWFLHCFLKYRPLIFLDSGCDLQALAHISSRKVVTPKNLTVSVTSDALPTCIALVPAKECMMNPTLKSLRNYNTWTTFKLAV